MFEMPIYESSFSKTLIRILCISLLNDFLGSTAGISFHSFDPMFEKGSLCGLSLDLAIYKLSDLEDRVL